MSTRLLFDPHEYTEKSARARLERRRAAGETGLVMREIDGKWYTGTLVGPPCQSCKGRGHHYDSHWRAGGSPAVCGRCNGTGIEPDQNGEDQ